MGHKPYVGAIPFPSYKTEYSGVAVCLKKLYITLFHAKNFTVNHQSMKNHYNQN